MQTVTKIIMEHGLADRFIRVSQLDRLIGGSNQRRYGLVNRATKAGDLLRLKRGVYILADRYRTHPCHPFAQAQAFVPGSYISFETALAFHGWIPEMVFTTASVLPGRKMRFFEDKKTGVYSFHPLATRPGSFLELVSRLQIDGQIMLVAKPFRALMDLICLRKVEWKGIEWLQEGLRIDLSLLDNITSEDIQTLQRVYKHKRIKSFLSALDQELNID